MLNDDPTGLFLCRVSSQPPPAAETEELVSEDIGQRRRKLLASLLRAIEETSGGSLSHLEDPQETEGPTQHAPSNTCQTGDEMNVKSVETVCVIDLKSLLFQPLIFYFYFFPHEDPVFQSNMPARPFLPWAAPSGSFPPPQTAKPPVTRIRQGVMEMMTQQHELSAIFEVETPVNTSQVTGQCS